MAASSKQQPKDGVNIERGPRQGKRSGRARNTVQNNASKDRGRGGRQASRESNFWSRFDKLMGKEVKGLKVSLGPDKEWDIRRAAGPKGNESDLGGVQEDLGGLTKGGNQEARQPARTPSPATTPPAAEAASPAALPSLLQNIPAPQGSENRMAELAQLAMQNNSASANRAAARGEYPPAISNVPEQYQDDIMRASEKTGVKPGLIAAVMQNENAQFDPNAVSSAGAQGLMQTMPFWSDSKDDPMGSFDPAKRPGRSIMLGAKILDHYINQQGSVKKGLMAYNAGPGNMPYGRDYAIKVLQTLRDNRRR